MENIIVISDLNIEPYETIENVLNILVPNPKNTYFWLRNKDTVSTHVFNWAEANCAESDILAPDWDTHEENAKIKRDEELIQKASENKNPILIEFLHEDRNPTATTTRMETLAIQHNFKTYAVILQKNGYIICKGEELDAYRKLCDAYRKSIQVRQRTNNPSTRAKEETAWADLSEFELKHSASDPYFTNIPRIGDLTMDYLFFEYEKQPIIFVCRDIRDKLYLCLCSEMRDSLRHTIAPVDKSTLDALVDQTMDLATAFRNAEKAFVITSSFETQEDVQVKDPNELTDKDLPEPGTRLKCWFTGAKKYLQNKT